MKYPRVDSLSIVLPAYNEEENIAEAVEGAMVVLSEVTDDYEVVVVDDGSQDDTGIIIKRLLDKYPERLVFIQHHSNLGYGAALKSGFSKAAKELVFYTDSDLQFDLRELRYFLPMIDSYDVVVGFRVYRYDPILRLFMSWGYNKLVRLLFRLRMRDVDCAYKLFKREVLERIHIKCNDFFVDTEIMAKARYLGFSINQVGVKHFPRRSGKSTIRPTHILKTIGTIIRMWIEIILFQRV